MIRALLFLIVLLMNTLPAAADDKRPMRILPIVLYGDPVLRKKCPPVTAITDRRAPADHDACTFRRS